MTGSCGAAERSALGRREAVAAEHRDNSTSQDECEGDVAIRAVLLLGHDDQETDKHSKRDRLPKDLQLPGGERSDQRDMPEPVRQDLQGMLGKRDHP